MSRIRFAVMMLLLAAGCSALSPEAKIRRKLLDAGVKPYMAECLSGKLARKLDDDELRQLARVAELPNRHPGHLGFAELADRLRALDNPHIVEVVTRAGLGCAIAG